VFAHIVAGDVRQRGGEVMLGGRFQKRGHRIRSEPVGDPSPAPCAAEIETIEVRDLSVAAVRYEGRFE
jgi:hypothetical protein